MKIQAVNPILPMDEYVPDGEPHVFGDRVYLYGSHDKEGGDTYCMLPYVCWSAPVDNLADWSCSGEIFNPRQDPKFDEEKTPYVFAPDVVQGNDHKYYLYYCMAGYRGKGGYSQPISVAVCDRPDGHFEYLGEVKNPDGTPFMKYVNFDPAVINDDGVIRLYSGTWYPFDEQRNGFTNWKYDRLESDFFGKSKKHLKELRKAGDSVFGPFHMQLSDDMMTLASEPVRILPLDHKGTEFEEHGFFEGSSIRKIKDTYYFVYSSVKNDELCYATSQYPDRGFAYGGTIVSTGDVGFQGRKDEDRLNATGTTHGSIEQIGEDWYVFYHRLTHKTDYSRQACAQKIQIEPDGSIPQVEVTSCGLNNGPLEACGKYPAVICCNLTNGHMPHGSNKEIKTKIPYIGSVNGEQILRDIGNGSWIGYKYFNFAKSTQIRIELRGEGEGVLELYDSMEGEAYSEATCKSSTGWTQIVLDASQFTGIKPLYLKYTGSGDLEIKSLEFVYLC